MQAAHRQRPGGIWVGSHGKSGDGLYGVDPSPGSRSIEPGQRWFCPRVAVSVKSSSRSSGGTGWSWPATSW